MKNKIARYLIAFFIASIGLICNIINSAHKEQHDWLTIVFLILAVVLLFNPAIEYWSKKLKPNIRDKEFEDFVKRQRAEFSKVVSTYDPHGHNALRTESDSLLIAYDQMLDKLKTEI